MANRDSDRISSENSSDEGGSEIRLSSPNSLEQPTNHIHDRCLELENSHEVLRRPGSCTKSDEKSKSCDTIRVELEEKSRSYDVLRQELQQFEEKILCGAKERYEVLQQALTIHDQVVVDCRRQSRETKLVSEDIVRMIEPSVPEPGDENNEELLDNL
ncbi:hypothetical protein F511_31620 [Dorcoceras hygrometricum]|uniref:Uncharacterized protein n=1 Tax=Dorcoceras hygrometricum TaxID=472368 RepID=A0A2Z7C6P1_9LAMI|nr:hypothetical protein F511_31620 [Dorcoceras hygrometricum]